MTIRAILLGLLGAMFIAVVAFFNDHIWVLSSFVGSHLPVFVFGMVILTATVTNPILGAIRKSWQLRPAELATIVLMLLVACSIPSLGFLGTFTKVMTIPAQSYQNQESWQNNQLRERLPSYTIPAEGKVVPGFTDTAIRGGGTPEHPMAFNEVPWRYWVEPLTTWLPILLLFTTAVICISLIIHRQWSKNERLRYPIAEVANEFIHPANRKATIRTGAFICGFLIIFLIRVNNGIAAWAPQISPNGEWLRLPLEVNLLGIVVKWRAIQAADTWSGFWVGSTFFPVLYPTIIGIAFLLATDVSLTVGLAPWLYLAFALTAFKGFGYHMAGDGTDYMFGGAAIWQRFGSYLALLMIIIYVGRTYYWTILQRAFGFKGSQISDTYAVWACRILILAVVALCGLFTVMGLPWPIAILTVFLVLLVFIGMSRINCESGLFLNMPRWQPLGVLLGLLGASAIGPQAIMLVALISVLFTAAPMETLMPFFLNGLQICSKQDIKPARAGTTSIMTYILVLAVATPVVLWATHNYGFKIDQPRWSTKALPEYYYDAGDKLITKLTNESKLTASENFTTTERMGEAWGRLIHLNDDAKKFLVWAGLGLGGVLALGFLRLRLPWWPLHPMLFAIWGTRLAAEVGASFLIGWSIKAAVTNLGGKQSFQATRRVMLGFIAGDLLAAMVFMFVGVVYHTVTGKVPAYYPFFPSIT